jgi:hypothetical protein
MPASAVALAGTGTALATAPTTCGAGCCAAWAPPTAALLAIVFATGTVLVVAVVAAAACVSTEGATVCVGFAAVPAFNTCMRAAMAACVLIGALGEAGALALPDPFTALATVVPVASEPSDVAATARLAALTAVGVTAGVAASVCRGWGAAAVFWSPAGACAALVLAAAWAPSTDDVAGAVSVTPDVVAAGFAACAVGVAADASAGPETSAATSFFASCPAASCFES